MNPVAIYFLMTLCLVGGILIGSFPKKGDEK
jgi:uncharacterized protein YneF (UPF0154 family)